MSLVGPRPPLACFWLVCGRSDIPFEQIGESQSRSLELPVVNIYSGCTGRLRSVQR